ncbi:MAG: hypothetical protein GXY36_12780 [Chloroflexi bacterium]|nr:hypothetical protein [Chloroflexota bacterium]
MVGLSLLFTSRRPLTGGLLVGLLAAVLLAIAIPLAHSAPPAQSGTPIGYGSTLAGEITEAVPCAYYWFEGAAGDAITLDVARTSGSLDGVMWLYLRDGATTNADPLAFNDDRPGGGLDPLISTTLPTTDWYTVVVCRLQHEQMRVTTGTFNLTLSAQEAAPGSAFEAEDAAAEPAEAEPSGGGAGSLTDNILPSAISGAGGVAPSLQATPTPGGLGFGFLGGGTPQTAGPQPLTFDLSTAGQLAANQPNAGYTLAVQAGDQIALDWEGDFAPLVAVTTANGAALAQAGSREAAGHVRLVFVAPGTETLNVEVSRYNPGTEAAPGAFQLTPRLLAGGMPTPLPPIQATPTPGDSDDPPYLVNACQGALAPSGQPANSAYLVNVYTAAGDGFTPEELSATVNFRDTDDLNVVFSTRGGQRATVAAVFCGPDGTPNDAGSAESGGGRRYLLGLDWESLGIPWFAGTWTVEVYVNNVLEVVLTFEIG